MSKGSSQGTENELTGIPSAGGTLTAAELLRQGRHEELWRRCCGFLDMNVQQFMEMQNTLLLEQLQLLKNCELGRHLLKGAAADSVEEFRRNAPITTYADYDPFLPDQIAEALPERPLFWQRTSGRSEEYAYKRVPVTERMYQELDDTLLAIMILASCGKKGEITLEEYDRFLYAMAPPPYASGCWGRRAAEWGVFSFLPPIDEAEKMDFEERLAQGFQQGLSEGVDILFALTGLLLALGEQFGQGGGLGKLKPYLRKPGALRRMLLGFAKSKLAGRKMLPRDLWALKMLIGFGTDTSVYRDKLKEMWGRYPLDVYGSTETLILATQTWDYTGMTFVPQINYLEFVPEDQYRRFHAEAGGQPDIYALDEIEPGQNYGLVITNFRGGAYVRYFLGDVVKISAPGNERLGIALPQMEFFTRVEGLVELDGFVRLTERTIGKAVEDSGLPYKDWLARKRSTPNGDRLELFLEPKGHGLISVETAVAEIHAQLRELDTYYSIHTSLSGSPPLDIQMLPVGAFDLYIARQRQAGADLAHIKPPHMNPSDAIVATLITSEPATAAAAA